MFYDKSVEANNHHEKNQRIKMEKEYNENVMKHIPIFLKNIFSHLGHANETGM